MNKINMKMFLLSTLVISTFLKSQILLNNNSDLKIYLKENEIKNDEKPSEFNKMFFIIDNQSKEKYIINKRGFMGQAFVYKNDTITKPYLYKPFGSPADWTEKDCKKNILIINPNKKITTVLYLDIFDGWYNIENAQKNLVQFISEHTENSPYYFGCEDYVDKLIKKGYKIYIGTLEGKVNLVENN